jgi:hypothetical protein
LPTYLEDRNLTSDARAAARKLSYNNGSAEAEAKHLLIAVASRLDARTTWVHNGRVWDNLGQSRALTRAERLCWLVFSQAPALV